MADHVQNTREANMAFRLAGPEGASANDVWMVTVSITLFGDAFTSEVLDAVASDDVLLRSDLGDAGTVRVRGRTIYWRIATTAAPGDSDSPARSMIIGLFGDNLRI